MDFIVVGSGTAGSLLARRLGKKGRVLLLEAGGPAPFFTRVPIGYLRSIGHPRVDWLFQTEPEAGLGGRSLRYPRGKGLGGCTLINGMIHMRGQKSDYDGWAELLGDPSWSYSRVLPHFLRHENHWGGASAHHGGEEGEWRVEKQRVQWELLGKFADACEEAGIPRVADFNGGVSNFGVAPFEVSQRSGWRQDAGRAFLGDRPANVTVECAAHVDRILFDGNAAVGVRLADGSERRAGRVVLCAGAVGSPGILERSGVGSEKALERAGVRTEHRLEGVGEQLQDHLQLRHVFRVSGVSTLNTASRNWRSALAMGLQYLFWQRGPLSMAPSQLGVFASTLGDAISPNLQYHVQPLSLPSFGQPLHAFDAFTAAVCNLRPSSRGSVHIRTADPSAHPVIAPNYLSTEDDRHVAAEAIRLTRRLVASKHLAAYSPQEVLPGPEHQTDEELVSAAGKIGTTIFHPVGTCAMGSVCDSSMRVLGLKNLIVCDASAMPRITSGNTNAPTLMMAEKLASEMV